MKRTIVIVGGLILGSAIIYLLFFSTWLEIDHCLDSGGRWNYEKGACEW